MLLLDVVVCDLATLICVKAKVGLRVGAERHVLKSR
jgi:hypothetical protein